MPTTDFLNMPSICEIPVTQTELYTITWYENQHRTNLLNL